MNYLVIQGFENGNKKLLEFYFEKNLKEIV